MRRLPRFIAEDVLQQLNVHLNDLRPVYRGMTLVLEECGMRIGELCTLKMDCPSRDPEGDYFLVLASPDEKVARKLTVRH